MPSLTSRKSFLIKIILLTERTVLCDISLMLADAQGIGEFLGEMQERTFGPHDAFSVGEVFNIKDGELPDFVGDKGYFSSISILPLPLSKR